MAYDFLFLSQDDVQSLCITMEDVMAEVESGLKLKGEGKVELPPKPGVHPRENCYIHAMPCWVGGEIDASGLKWVAGFPQNIHKGLPYNNGVFCLNDSDNGLVKAIMDANWMTTWRTGAATGIGAKYFAPDAQCMAVIGLGTIGRINLRAVKTALPGLKQVKVFDIDPARLDPYISDMCALFPDLEYVPCTKLKEACSDVSILTTSTPILENPPRPVDSAWIDENCLCIATDYDSSLDARITSGSGVFVCDDRGQYLWTQEQGVYFQNGYPTESGIYADMGEVCSGKKKPVTEGRRTCVFMGIASHDVMTANLIYKKAIKSEIGRWLKL